MGVVGKRTSGTIGNIYIDTPSSPHATSDPLFIRGSVASNSQVILQRDLTDNSETPAEFFEYAPELLVQYPNIFTKRSVTWREVAP